MAAFGTSEESTVVTENKQETEFKIVKSRKNRISKRQRMDCFRAALGDFLREAKKYQHSKSLEPIVKYAPEFVPKESTNFN